MPKGGGNRGWRKNKKNGTGFNQSGNMGFAYNGGGFGNNSVSFANYSGGYGGGYGSHNPNDVHSQFVWGGNSGNNFGSNGFNYNNNPEWYGGSSNGGGCFDDSFNVDEGYVYSHQMPNPWQPGCRPQGGQRRWEGPRKQSFKKKSQKNEKNNLAATKEEGQKKKKKNKKKAQQKTSEAHVTKFNNKTMALKNKYRSVRQNRHLCVDDQLVLVFLKHITHEVWQGEDSDVHLINFAKLATRHRNAIKLFIYECKKQLDVKYAPDGEEKHKEKLDYLLKSKKDIIDGYKKSFKHRSANEDMDAKEKRLDDCIAKLSGETFTEDDVPEESDFLFDINHSRRKEDFVTEFMYDFVFNCYETFKFKANEHKTHTKDLNKRLRYHLDARIIPFLIVESVKAKSLVTSVPSPINKIIFKQSEVLQGKNEDGIKKVVELMVKKNENVVTPIANYVDLKTATTDVIRDFADCILLFDRFATYAKFRMLEYSPHILLPRDQKEKLFNQLVDQMYREVLEIVLKKESFETSVFPAIQKDEGFNEAADEDIVEIKEEPVEVQEEPLEAVEMKEV